MKKNIFRNSVVALFIGFTTFAFSQGMEKYTSVEGKFSATFPTDGEKIIKTEDLSEEYKTYKLQTLKGENVFFVAYTIHEIKLENTDELVKVSADSFVEGLEGEILESEDWIVNKQNGLKATFKSLKNNLFGEYRVVIIGKIQYQMAVAGEVGNWNQKTANKFFKSFKVKK